MTDISVKLAEAAFASLGFFWKAGWAFVMGYAISAMIQAFVPRHRMTRHMADLTPGSLFLSSSFGALSSSCSFAALAAARALFAKGAHFVLAVAFMFASTNLVIELGVLIWIFLGWQYLVAEIIGGILLIIISALLMRLIYPREWIRQAREQAEEDVGEQDSFSPWRRMMSLQGWQRVGHHFVAEWKMVWQEILIGFTVAGLVKAFIPESFWKALFLMDWRGSWPDLALDLQNALVAPIVAAMTFIGSMGNIPLATVLANSGVAFAGVMAFIYSDLMVPPLVKVNAGYYGWRIALYVAGIMYASIVLTALILNAAFAGAGVVPHSQVSEVGGEAFAIDYTFFFNVAFVFIAAVMIWLHRGFAPNGPWKVIDPRDWTFQSWVVASCVALLVVGLVAGALTG